MYKVDKHAREIARRIKNAGFPEAAKIIRSGEIECNKGVSKLSQLFAWELTPQGLQYWASIANALDQLGWEGGWRDITS
jgi:hypothetical protein